VIKGVDFDFDFDFDFDLDYLMGDHFIESFNHSVIQSLL